jgi:hypothetical protein
MTHRLTLTVPDAFDELDLMEQRDVLMDGVACLNRNDLRLAALVLDAVDDDLSEAARQHDPRDNDLWFVQVTVTRPDGRWSSSRTLPTFVLDGAVQGIEDVAGAVTIAADVMLVDIAPDDWAYLATVRRGNQSGVYSTNLRTRNVWLGDHINNTKDLS